MVYVNSKKPEEAYVPEFREGRLTLKRFFVMAALSAWNIYCLATWGLSKWLGL